MLVYNKTYYSKKIIYEGEIHITQINHFCEQFSGL